MREKRGERRDEGREWRVGFIMSYAHYVRIVIYIYIYIYIYMRIKNKK